MSASKGKQQEYKNLCTSLREYNKAYAEGNFIISNEEYDVKFRRVQRLLATSPELIDIDDFPTTIGYKSDGGDDDVELPVKMYSTDNLFTFEEFYAFISKMLLLGMLIITRKIDGIAVSIHVKNGSIENISTRGDGMIGKKMNHLGTLFYKMKLMPGDYTIHGEFYATKSILTEDLGYRSLQSAANGLRSKLKYYPGLLKHVGFAAYNFIPKEDDLSLTYLERLKTLTTMGFETVEVIDQYKAPMSKIHLLALYHWLLKVYNKRNKELEYDIDGFVVRFNDMRLEKEAGETKRTLKAVQAIKFQTCYADTEVLEVLSTVGDKGNDSGVVIVREVILNGKRINKVKLPSLSRVPKKGMRCRIVLSGMSVPIIQF